MPTLDDVLKVYRKKVIGHEEFENELKGFLERLIDTTQRFNYPASGFFKQTKFLSDANDVFTLWYNTKEQNGADGITQPGSVAKKFASASATFTEADIGKLILIWGASDDDNNGVYQITEIINSTNVYVDHDFNSNETTLDWELNRPVGCNCRYDTNYRIVELMNEKFYDLNGYTVAKNPLTWRIPFENNTGTTYSIGIKKISIPYDLEVNARNGRPYYRAYRETIGEIGTPDSISLVSGNPKLIIDGLVGNPGGGTAEDHSGIKARVWLVDPQARTRTEGMEEVTIQFSGGQNFIQCAGKLGQTTSSTTATDYVVAIESVTWRDKANLDLSTDPDYAFVGDITGLTGSIPVGFNTTGQVVFGSDLIDTLNINQLAKDIYTGGIGDLGGDGNPKFTNPIEDWIGVQHYGPDHADYGEHKDVVFDHLYGRVTIAGAQLALRAKDGADESVVKLAVRDSSTVDRVKLYGNGNIVADGNLTIGDGTDNISTFNGKVKAGANAFWGTGVLSFYDDVAILADKKLHFRAGSGGSLTTYPALWYNSGADRFEINAGVGGFDLTGLVRSGDNIELQSGADLILVSGNLSITLGDVNLINGDITLTSGDVVLTSGDIVIDDGNAEIEGNIMGNVGTATAGAEHRVGSIFKTISNLANAATSLVADPAAQGTTFTAGYYHVFHHIAATITDPKSNPIDAFANNGICYIGEGNSSAPATSSTIVTGSKLWIDLDDGNKMKFTNGEGNARDVVLKIERATYPDSAWVI